MPTVDPADLRGLGPTCFGPSGAYFALRTSVYCRLITPPEVLAEVRRLPDMMAYAASCGSSFRAAPPGCSSVQWQLLENGAILDTVPGGF